jgi:hypothetical protein
MSALCVVSERQLVGSYCIGTLFLGLQLNCDLTLMKIMAVYKWEMYRCNECSSGQIETTFLSSPHRPKGLRVVSSLLCVREVEGPERQTDLSPQAENA